METENELSKKCPETENIYTDIIEFDLGTEVEKLREENRLLEDHIDSLEVDIEKLADALRRLKAIQENLAQNISSLYLTAKAELSRKDRIIDDLRKQLDDVVFRRGKRKPLSRSPVASSKRGRYEQPGESIDSFDNDYENDPPYITGQSERGYENDVRGNEPNYYYDEERCSDSASRTYKSYRRNVIEKDEHQRRKRYSNHDRNSNYDRTEFTSRSRRNLSNTSRTNYRNDPRIEKLRRESNLRSEEYRFSSEEERDVRNKRPRTPRVEKIMTEKEPRGEQTKYLKSDKKPGTPKIMKAVQKLEPEMMEKKASSHSSLEDLSQITEPNRNRRANYFVDHMEHIMNNVLLDISDTKLITVSKKEEKFADARSASSGVLSGDESASRESFNDPCSSHNNFPAKSCAADNHNPPLGERESKIVIEQLKQKSNEKEMKQSEAERNDVVGGSLESVNDTKKAITAKHTKLSKPTIIASKQGELDIRGNVTPYVDENIENELKSVRLEKQCSNKVQSQMKTLPETSTQSGRQDFTKDKEMLEGNREISKSDDEMFSEKKEEDDSVNEKFCGAVVGKEMELSNNLEENEQMSSICKITTKAITSPKTPKFNSRYKIPKKDKELPEKNPLTEKFDSAEGQRNIVLVSLDEHKTSYKGRFKSVDEEHVDCRASRTKSVPRSFPRKKPEEKIHKIRSKSRECRSRLGDEMNKYSRSKSCSGENEYRKCYEERRSQNYKEHESRHYDQRRSRNYEERKSRNYEERKSRNHEEHESRNYDERKSRNYEQHESRNYEEHESRYYEEHESRNYEERKSRHYDERKNRNYEDDHKTSQKENTFDVKHSKIERRKCINYSEDTKMSTRSQRVGESSDKYSDTSVTKKSSETGKRYDSSSHKNHQTVGTESSRRSSTAYNKTDNKKESQGNKNIPTVSKSKSTEDLEISRVTSENKDSTTKMKYTRKTETNEKKITRSSYRKVLEAEEKIIDIKMKVKSSHKDDTSEKEEISDMRQASDETGNHETTRLEISRQKDSKHKEDEEKTVYPNNRNSMEILKKDKVHGITSPFSNDDEDAEVEKFPQNKSKTQSNANTIEISNKKPDMSMKEFAKQSNDRNIVGTKSLENLNPGGEDKRKRNSLLENVTAETKRVVNDTENLTQKTLSLRNIPESTTPKNCPEATPPESKEVECFSTNKEKLGIANSHSKEVPQPKSTKTMESIIEHLKKDASESIQRKSSEKGTHKRKRENEMLEDTNTSKHSRNINAQESSRDMTAEPCIEDKEVKYIEGIEKRNTPKILSQGIDEHVMPNLIPLKQTLLPKKKQDENDKSSNKSMLQNKKPQTSKTNQKEELLQNNDSDHDTKPSKSNTVDVLSKRDSYNTVGTKKARKDDVGCPPHSELRMSGTNVPVVLETGSLQATIECSTSVAAQASARKRITPIRIGDSPVCSFENILEKNRMPSFAKELSAPNAPPLTLTNEGDIPLLHLEENHFQSLNDDGTQKSFDKSILNLLDNMSNLDCDMTKLGVSSEKEENSKRAGESVVKPNSESAGVAAPVSSTCDIKMAPPAEPMIVTTATIQPPITSTPKQKSISERESTNIVQNSGNVINIDKSGDSLRTPTLNNSRNLTGLGRRRRARIVFIDKT